jgi:formylmethanofuran dehydrogenase subunit B
MTALSSDKTEANIFTDVACTVCGCVCDDLELRIAGGRIEKAEHACRLAEPWFFALNDSHPPVAAIEGAAASLDEGLQRASHILRASRNPLIFGLSQSSTPGQRAAVQLAEQLGGTIDPVAAASRAAAILALQEVGQSTCSLGEVRNRADLIIFWRSDPVETHPRHLERFSADPQGEFLPQGRRDRRIVVIDVKPTATSHIADIFLQIEPGRDFDLIWALRRAIRGDGDDLSGCPAGITPEVLQELARRMKECRYGALFFGPGLADPEIEHLALIGLFRLVAELNAHTRFTASALGDPGDAAGAENVLCWQTGFPFAVNFGRGYPRYSPGEFTVETLLGRGEADACVLIGSRNATLLSPAAQAAFSKIPTIVLDLPNMRPPFAPTVQFTTAVYGIHAAGTAFRMDDVPIPLRQLIGSEYPTDEAILSDLSGRLG